MNFFLRQAYGYRMLCGQFNYYNIDMHSSLEKTIQKYNNRDKERWIRMSILNTANSGKFSTDRTMHEYNREIWRLTPIAPYPSKD